MEIETNISYIKKNKAIATIITIILFFISFFIVSQHLNYEISKRLLTGGDLDPVLNLNKGWDYVRFTWIEEVFGLPYWGIWYLPYLLVLHLLYIVSFGNIILANNLFIVVILFSIFFSVYRLSIMLSKSNVISILSLLFFISIPFVFETLHELTWHTALLFAINNFLIISWIRLYNSKYNYQIILNILVLVILSLFLMRFTPLGQMSLLMFSIFLSIVLYSFSDESNIDKIHEFLPIFKKIIIFYILLFLIEAPYIIAYYSSLHFWKSEGLEAFNKECFISNIQNTKFINLMRSVGMVSIWAYIHDFFNESSAGMFTWKGLILYKYNTLWMLASFTPILLVLILYFITLNLKSVSNNKKVKIGIFLIILVFILGFNLFALAFPSFIIKNNMLLYLFRSLQKYSQYFLIQIQLIIFILCVSEIYKLKAKKSASFLLLFVSMCLIFSSACAIYAAYYNGSFFHKRTNIEIPKDIFRISEVINRYNDVNGKVLLYPLTNQLYGYIEYSWGYAGPDIFHWTINNNVIEKHYNQIQPRYVLNELNNISSGAVDENILERYNIKFIILRNSWDLSRPYFKPMIPIFIAKNRLNNLPYLRRIYADNKFIVYENSERSSNIYILFLYININNSEIIIPFKKEINIHSLKVNPTLWKVKINAQRPFMLSFAESYDPLWEARIYKNGQKIKTVKSIPLYSVINGFWIDEPGDLEIVIRYKPQDWFKMGLAISALTFIGCIGYLFYDWRRNKTLSGR